MPQKQPLKFVPVNQENNNSVDVTGFAVGFQRPFNTTETNNFRNLETILKSYLPTFSTLMGFSVTIQQTPGASQQVVSQDNSQNLPQGVLLQKFGPDGKVDWSLQVSQTNIVVNCFNYTRWADVWGETKYFLLEIIKLIDEKTNKISFFALQVIDKFIYESKDDYLLKDIFDENSKFLTSYAKETGKYWHVHQGWFESFPLSNTDVTSKCLNVLNVGSIDADSGLFTIIDHNQQVLLGEPLSLSNLLSENNKDGILEKSFNTLHRNNKTIIATLFNKETLDVIQFHG